MNEKDIKLFKYRHRCTVLYGWVYLPAIILSIESVLFLIGFYVVAPIEGTEYVEWAQ